MKRIFVILVIAFLSLGAFAQVRKVQNKPYIDLRPLHFGISIGLNLQDAEFTNVGQQTLEDGTTRTISCDVDSWNPGFSVGVLADLRLGQHLNFRVQPTMHFGSKRLTFLDYDNLNEAGQPIHATQDLKSSYLSFPLDLKFSAERFNNYRPYVVAGLSPMINLTGYDKDYIQLKRFDAMVNIGMGCDFYLPFFKLIPEIKFCYGLINTLDSSHAEKLTDVNKRAFSYSVDNCRTKMFLFTLYFE